jgi:hypothetical protein
MAKFRKVNILYIFFYKQKLQEMLVNLLVQTLE